MIGFLLIDKSDIFSWSFLTFKFTVAEIKAELIISLFCHFETKAPPNLSQGEECRESVSNDYELCVITLCHSELQRGICPASPTPPKEGLSYTLFVFLPLGEVRRGPQFGMTENVA